MTDEQREAIHGEPEPEVDWEGVAEMLAEALRCRAIAPQEHRCDHCGWERGYGISHNDFQCLNDAALSAFDAAKRGEDGLCA